MVPPPIAHSPNIDLEPELFRAELPDAPAVEAPHPIGCLHVAVNVDRLVEIEVAARAVPEGMKNMVSVLDAEAREDHPLLIGLPIPIVILHIEQVGRIGYVGALIIIRHHAGRHEKAIGEYRRAVGGPISIEGLENQYPVIGHLSRLDMGIDPGARHPETATGIKVHVDWLGDHRVGGEEVHLESLCGLKLPELSGRIRLRSLAQVTLSLQGAGHQRQRRQEECRKAHVLHLEPPFSALAGSKT